MDRVVTGRSAVDAAAVRRDDEAIEAVAARRMSLGSDRALRLLAALAVEVDTGLPRPVRVAPGRR